MVHLFLGIIYLSFISLGLPDALLGAAWPSMCLEFGVPVSYAGAISMIIAGGTIFSSLMSDRLTRWLGTAKVTAISVAITAIALFGFSISRSYWMLLLWAVPYGLGAGSVDASLNNYVALHYTSRHMSWLHCMWGLGASVGPYILGYALNRGHGWNMGYRYISVIQTLLTVILIFSLPMWKSKTSDEIQEQSREKAPLSLKKVLAIPGAKEIFISFFCYCAVEQTVMLWASTYLVLSGGMEESAAAEFASLFLLGLTFGRGASGFLTYKLNDRRMIRLGQSLILLGVIVMLLPLGGNAALAGLVCIGLGCAPIYPCMIHATPEYFGAENSQAVIGVQMASAYVGTMVMPAAFGLIANHLTSALLPWYLGIVAVVMLWMCESLNKKTARA